MPEKKSSVLILIAVALLVIIQISCFKVPQAPDADVGVLPVIWVSVSDLYFTASETGQNPPSQIIQVKNSGAQTLNYSLSGDVGWASFSPDNGVSTGNINEHSVFIDKSSLFAQVAEFVGTITVSDPESYNSPQTVNIHLTVTEEPPPQIWINTNQMTFAAQVDGPNPPAQTLNINNTGQGTLNYTVASNTGWLTVSPDSGTTTGAASAHQVSVNSSGLSEGIYTGQLTIADPNASNSPQIVEVTLTLSTEPPPEVGVSTTSLVFNTITTGPNPPPQSFTVMNGGGGTLNYTITSSAAWLTVSPTNGISTGDDINHSVSVDKSSLGQGIHMGTISISDPNALYSPQQIIVTVNVNPPDTSNEIWIVCGPAAGGTGTVVTVYIAIRGNTSEIDAFGLDVNFSTAMFEYLATAQGELTGGWSVVGNDLGSGVIRVGGYAGGASAIPTGSEGSVAVMQFRVTCTGCANGSTSQICIGSFVDDIVGMSISLDCFTFTFNAFTFSK